MEDTEDTEGTVNEALIIKHDIEETIKNVLEEYRRVFGLSVESIELTHGLVLGQAKVIIDVHLNISI
jgi:hypothetical protein